MLNKAKDLIRRGKIVLFGNRYALLEKYTEDFSVVLGRLFSRAANVSGFDYLCTLLRVQGITSGHWDAFVESEDGVKDFSRLMKGMRGKRAIRMGLFLYCHLTEMSAPYEIIANLLRCVLNKPYQVFPFQSLMDKRAKNKGSKGKVRAPYPIEKVQHIKELALLCGESRITDIIDQFFSNDIRNAFYHSDYAISESEFRIVEGRSVLYPVTSLEDISLMLIKCFAFYTAFFAVYNKARKDLVVGKRFHRWPNYDVLELLTGAEGLTGFKVHFPTGQYAMFERKKYQGTDGLNIITGDNSIKLNVGDLNKYREADNWYVNGKPFEELNTRYNPIGIWRPLIFQRDNQKLYKKILETSSDKKIHGPLLYILATGHASLEFVVKSNKRLTARSVYKKIIPQVGRLELHQLPAVEKNVYLYDGTVYLLNKTPDILSSGLSEIEQILAHFKRTDSDINYRIKYDMYPSVAREVVTNGDTFTMTISFDDPRSTMIASDLKIFPKSDWIIRPEWVE